MLRPWLAALLILSAAGLVRAEPVLRLVGDPWPPYTDQGLPGGGLAVELVRTALARAGYRVEYTEMPWTRATRGLRQGRFDLYSAWYVREREPYALHSAPYLFNRLRWITRRDEPIVYDGLDSLRGLRVALVRGYSYSDRLTHDTTLTRVLVNNFTSAARMLTAGRVDLTLEDERTALYHFDHELSLVREAYEFLPGEFQYKGLRLVVRRSHPQHRAIVAAFEREIAAMREDGTLQRILDRHSFGETPVDHRRARHRPGQARG